MSDGPVANERWLRIKALFAGALEQPAEAVSAWLDTQCGDDAELRRDVESLIASHHSDPAFMEAPAIADPRAARAVADRVTPSVRAAMIGRRLGPYRLVAELGRGGMGVVYLAERDDQAFDRQVAIKMVYGAVLHPSLVDRFEAERRILAGFDHPNIGRLLDAGTDENATPFAVMEYIQGAPIDEYARTHRLSVARRLALFCLVCDAVQYSHERLVVHRDIKPGNVLVTEDGVPKLLDFGIAKLLDASNGATEQTRTDLRALTPESASPEQVRGDPITVASDVYSLGVLLFRLLTDSSPYRDKTLAAGEIARAICDEEPRRPSDAVAGSQAGLSPRELVARQRELKGDLDWITMKALEKTPARRYGTVSDLAADIRRYLFDQPVLARPRRAIYRTRKFVRRHPFGVGVPATLVVLVTAFGITMTMQAQRVARERDRANREAVRANQEAEAAKRVTDFIIGLFKVSDPNEARGHTVTAREILSAAAVKIEESLNDQPAIRARLQATIGGVYTNLGLFSEAEPLLRQSVDTLPRVVGDDHPDTLTAINALADLYWYQSRFSEAEPLYRELVRRAERRFGKEHERTLKARFDLASLYVMQNRFDETERLIRETLEVQRRVLGKEHRDTLGSMSVLQALYFRQKRYVDALPVALEVLEISRKVLGENDRKTAQSVHNVATIYDRLDFFDEARRFYLAALTIEDRVLGDRHPDSCNTREKLGVMYRKRGRYSEAEPLFLKAWEGREQTLGHAHPSTVVVIRELAALYRAWHKDDQAAEWEKKLPRSK